MSNEIEIKMLEDESGEFYTKTHLDAIDGMEEYTESLTQLAHLLGDYITDSKWKSYDTDERLEINKMYSSNGFNCGIRKVILGYSGYGNGNQLNLKTIRVNIKGFKHNQKVAQLPTGFMKQTQVFWARGGDNHQPIMVEVNKNGDIIIKLMKEDQNKTPDNNWIYSQFTWIE